MDGPLYSLIDNRFIALDTEPVYSPLATSSHPSVVTLLWPLFTGVSNPSVCGFGEELVDDSVIEPMDGGKSTGEAAG